MNRMSTRRIIAANALFTLHLMVGALILTGWMFPEIRAPYLMLLIGWPLCWIVFGYCPLTKWELKLRNVSIADEDLNGEFTKYHMKRFFNVDLPSRPIFITGTFLFLILLFLTLSGYELTV
jgi:hypothetical protein